MQKTIGFIGAGNMGEAIIGAILEAKIFSKTNVWISDINSERLSQLENTYGVQTTTDNADLFGRCDIIILAVKPQQMNDILTQIAPGEKNALSGTKLVISIAAGIRIEKIEAVLYAALSPEESAKLPVIRVMPNTPALVLQGVSGMSANRHATPADVETARQILAAMGTAVVFGESDLDAVTALSGSGPAYVFYLAESMINAGIKLGLSKGSAQELAVGTIKGAAALMEQRRESPEDLRRKVTSPGGTTEAAFNVLEKNNVRDIIIEAIKAAEARSKELSQ